VRIRPAESLYPGTELRENGDHGDNEKNEMRNPPAAAHWLSQIEGARSAADVVRVLREYLASLTMDNRAQFLPDEAIRVSSAAEVQELAVTLAHLDLKGGASPDDHALHEAAMVLAAASTRLAKVGG
jgi:hypothetical protein